MKFVAEIDVMPLKELLDPQGKAVKLGLQNLELPHVSDVRIGKHISLQLEADSLEKAEAAVETACKKLLSNMVMESYEYQLKQVD